MSCCHNVQRQNKSLTGAFYSKRNKWDCEELGGRLMASEAHMGHNSSSRDQNLFSGELSLKPFNSYSKVPQTDLLESVICSKNAA